MKANQPISEGESQTKLHLPGIVGERCDSSKGLVANRQSRITALRGRRVPVLDIEHIERLEAELERHAFSGQWNALKQRDIHVVHGLAPEHIAPEIPERT